MSDTILITPEALRGLMDERAILVAHRDELMKERLELVRIIRSLREGVHEYWQHLEGMEVCSEADAILAKYLPECS